MSVHTKPRHKFLAALIAAGVVSAASVVNLPAPRELPTVGIEVMNTSAVTNSLAAFGQGVEVANALVGIHVDAVISLPFEATLAVLAAAQHPELGPNVLSFLVQRFVNPAVGDPIHAYPYDTELTVSRLAELLPYPLGPSATQPGLINDGGKIFADVFNSVLGQLPDPIPGYEAVNSVMRDTVLGGVVVASHLAARAPMNMIWNTANYLGYLPANVEAAFESAITAPDQIPGLVSYLVHGLLSPDPTVGLFGKLLDSAVDPFTWLPGPVGYQSAASTGAANQIRDAIAGVMNSFLSALPAPVTPSALPPGTGPVLGPRGGVSNAKQDFPPAATAPDPALEKVSAATDLVDKKDDDAQLTAKPTKVGAADEPAKKVVEVTAPGPTDPAPAAAPAPTTEATSPATDAPAPQPKTRASKRPHLRGFGKKGESDVKKADDANEQGTPEKQEKPEKSASPRHAKPSKRPAESAKAPSAASA